VSATKSFGNNSAVSEAQELSVRQPRSPNVFDFQQELFRQFREAFYEGIAAVTIDSADLHASVGGHPESIRELVLCCQVMRSAVAPGDVLISDTEHDDEKILRVTYLLPRKAWGWGVGG
jgi:hypothetical protein